MKKKLFLQSFICLLAVSCTVRELDVIAPTPVKEGAEDIVFYADLESYSDPETRVYLDENIKILWDEADLISIFNKSTLNQKFMFDGETGENAGTFHWVRDDYFGAGNDLDYIYSVYPYQESATISNAGILTLTLPAEQTYREKSFGPGANTMVSVTEGNLLKFKNVGGYLALKFYGGDSDNIVSVTSITLAGNNGEPLAGEATMTPVFGEDPHIEMAPTAGKAITLNCGEDGVELGADADNATIFWMVVPPTDFTDGFTLTVTGTNGDVFIKETHVPLEIARNGVLRIKAIEVDMNSDGLSLTNIAPVNEKTNFETEVVEATRTATVTMPTVTNFSDLLFNYSMEGGDQVMVNGITLVNGETAIDASGEKNTVVVRNGQHGKSYKLLVRNTGLPVVRVSTSEFFDREHLESYLNLLQSQKINSRDTFDHRIWLPEGENEFVSVRIEYPDGSPGMKNTSNVPIYEAATKIKGRGNYTWIWEKKPYALKFDSKAEVLGMPAHKRWILLANWRDRTLLRNDATFWLSKHSGLPYTVRGQFVELEFNGEHRGNYYLCEQIKIDGNRVDIAEFKDDLNDPTGGYLMEIDSYWDELNKFKSNYFKFKYMFKEPDEDTTNGDPNDPLYAEGFTWMKTYINRLEKIIKTKSAVENGEYAEKLDVDSAIMLMIINELTGNRDFFQGYPHNGPHSTYLYKDKGENSKLFMGPVWDFDYETFIPSDYYSNSGYKWRGFDNHGFYYYFLCHDQDFVDRIKELWALRKSEFAKLPAYIDEMVEKIALSQHFDEKMWPYDPSLESQENRKDNHDYGLSYPDAITRMINSFNSKLEWMDGEFEDLETTSPSGYVDNKGRWHSGEWIYQ